MIKPLTNPHLQVHGIAETCINVAEILRAREFYQSLFRFEVMVSDERFCALRVGSDVLLTGPIFCTRRSVSVTPR